MLNIINRWRSVSKLYRLTLQRTAGGESAEGNVYIEWASEGDRNGRQTFRVWKTERGLSVNKRRHMLVCKSGRPQTPSGVAPQVLSNLSRQSFDIDCRAFFWSSYVLFFNQLALSACRSFITYLLLFSGLRSCSVTVRYLVAQRTVQFFCAGCAAAKKLSRRASFWMNIFVYIDLQSHTRHPNT